MNKVTWLGKEHDTKMLIVGVRVWAQAMAWAERLSIQRWMFIKMEHLFHPQFMSDSRHVSSGELS
jgi:hypothetical protein